MIFITANGKLHLFDNFWTSKTQKTEYNYIYIYIYIYIFIYVENYVYRKL